MKILITGADGQLGQTLRRTLADHTLEACNRSTLDLTDPVAVAAKFAEFTPEVVINAAAYTAVDKAESNVALADAVNHMAVATIASQCALHRARLFHISTDFVFDGKRNIPYPANAPCHPVNQYGKTKRNGELAVLRTLPETGIVIRTAWLYSRFGNNFVKTMLRLMRERIQIKVVSDQIGTPTHAATLADLICSMIMAPPAAGIYHCSDAGVASWYDFAIAIQEEAITSGLLDQPIEILPIATYEYPTPARRPAFSVLDKADTYRTCAMPIIHWRAMLRRALQEIAQQEKQLG